MERNKIDNLSGAVSNMLELEYLNLSHCQLSTIPRELGSCSALRKLDISNNRWEEMLFSSTEAWAEVSFFLSEYI